MRHTAIAFLSVFLFSCSSTPPMPSEAATDVMAEARTGRSTSSAESGDTIVPVAGSYLGDATNENVHAAAVRTTSTSASGPVQQAFNLAGVVDAQKAHKELVEASPVLAALTSQLSRLQAAQPVDEAAVASVIEKIAAETARLQDFVGRSGGDLSGLKSLTVVNYMRNATGAEQKSLTDAEAQAAQSGLTSLIEAAKGGDDQ